MELGWEIFRAMLFCPYKAWRLIQKEHYPSDPLERFLPNPNKQTLQDKTATGALLYSKEASTGQTFKITEKAKKLFENVRDIAQKKEPPIFYKNSHCSDCHFWDSCYQKLKERDCISLLSGMTPKVLFKYHSKGLYSIVQLSYLFRLRRRRRVPKVTGRYLWELKALAIRDNKTFVLQLPEIKTDPDIYLDFEGMPDDNSIYLIGGSSKARRNI
jgi:predicted RecB family nuclease